MRNLVRGEILRQKACAVDAPTIISSYSRQVGDDRGNVTSLPVRKIHNILLLPMWSVFGALLITCASAARFGKRRAGFRL